MGVHGIHGNISEAVPGDIDTALGQDKEDSHRLGDGGLSAPVGPRQDIDRMVPVEGQIIGDYLPGILQVQGKLQIIDAGSLRDVIPGKLRLREPESPSPLLLDEFRKSYVIDELRYQFGYVHHGNVHVL